MVLTLPCRKNKISGSIREAVALKEKWDTIAMMQDRRKGWENEETGKTTVTS